MQQAILHVLRMPNVPGVQGRSQRTALRRLLELIPQCDPPAPLTLEMLKIAVEMDKADMLRTLVSCLPNPEIMDAFPDDDDDADETLDEIRWDCSVGVDDLIRLELSLQSHQTEECYNVLVVAIKACSSGIYPQGLQDEVAHSLGFENLEALKAARVAIRNMWFDGEPDYEEFPYDEYEGVGGALVLLHEDELMELDESEDDDDAAEEGVYVDIGEGPRVVEMEDHEEETQEDGGAGVAP